MRLVKVAVACVNQTPFAWDDNLAHLRLAIEQCHSRTLVEQAPRGRPPDPVRRAAHDGHPVVEPHADTLAAPFRSRSLPLLAFDKGRFRDLNEVAIVAIESLSGEAAILRTA